MQENKEELKQYIEKIERLEEEKRDLTADITSVYNDAKSRGYDVKTMREIIKLRKMSQPDRTEYSFLLDEYKKLLGIEE